MRPAFAILGVIALLIGLVWVLQGANLLTGSPMSGSSLWLGIGAVLLVVGLGLLVLGMRSPRQKEAPRDEASR